MMLADVGADVLKVEPPSGDDSRGWLPFASTRARRTSAYFLSANRGKRSVRLDLKPADGERLRALCAEADVLVENYRPGLMARLGVDPADLRRPTHGWSPCPSRASAAAVPTARAPASTRSCRPRRD